MTKGLVISMTLLFLFMLARIMVKKRILLSKLCVIGKESPEKTEELVNLAKTIFYNGILSTSLNFDDGRLYSLSIQLRENQYEMVKISTEKIIITCSSETPEPVIFQNGLSELGATVYIFLVLILIFIFIALIFKLIFLLF